MSASLATVSYIGATILFILSLGGLSNPESSRRGNLKITFPYRNYDVDVPCR